MRSTFLFCGLGVLVAGCGGSSTTASSSGSSGSSGSPGSPGSSGDVPPVATGACDASAASDVQVSTVDLNGFPPYAVSGCTLVYVSRDGQLVSRDLATRAETVIATAAEKPRRPTASPVLVAWEADDAGHAVVRVRKDGAVTTLTGAFTTAGEPRASGAAVSFTTSNLPTLDEGDTDVWLYEAKTGAARLVVGGPGQQRFSDVSSEYVAVSDFSPTPDGRFRQDGKDLGQLVIFDRASGKTIIRATGSGKQAFPMLGEHGVIAFLNWIHPEPKFLGYELRSGTVTSDPANDVSIADVNFADFQYVRPALVGTTLEWVANPSGRATLYRSPVDGSRPPTAVTGLDNLRLYAPAPTAVGTGGFTVLATSPIGVTEVVPMLRAVPR